MRDPRGIVRSRKIAGWKGAQKYEAEKLCQQMLDDLKIKKCLPEERWDISGEKEIDQEKLKHCMSKAVNYANWAK